MNDAHVTAVATSVLVFAMGSASAQGAYEARAVGKDGKPSAGAAKASFMKKCEAGA